MSPKILRAALVAVNVSLGVACLAAFMYCSLSVVYVARSRFTTAACS